MNPDIIAQLHQSPWKGVIAVTGCAPLLVSNLLSSGGGSATLLEAVVPYATKSLEQFVGYSPEKFCSRTVAAEMASKAYSRATEIRADFKETTLFGLGITATLRKNSSEHERSDRINQAFINLQTMNYIQDYHIVFSNKLNREKQEEFLASIALKVLARNLLNEEICFGDWVKDHFGNWVEKITDQRFFNPDKLKDILVNPENRIIYNPLTNSSFSVLRKQIVISGSFNPIHDGHLRMAEVANQRFSLKPVFELSIANMDKGSLSGFEVLARAKAFKDFMLSKNKVDFSDFVVTNAASFHEKSYLFPECLFVVGIDTWYRIQDPKYYPSEKVHEYTLGKIKENGCRFLVVGRIIGDTYHTLPTEKNSDGLAIGLSEEEFRVDLSSTELRKTTRSVQNIQNDIQSATLSEILSVLRDHKQELCEKLSASSQAKFSILTDSGYARLHIKCPATKVNFPRSICVEINKKMVRIPIEVTIENKYH